MAVRAPAAGSAARRHRTWRREAAHRLQVGSPAFLVASFLHLAALVALSFWTVAVHFSRPREPIEARLLPVREVLPVTAGAAVEAEALDALLAASERDVPTLTERDTDDLFHEARGDAAGDGDLLGLGQGGRAGGRSPRRPPGPTSRRARRRRPAPSWRASACATAPSAATRPAGGA